MIEKLIINGEEQDLISKEVMYYNPDTTSIDITEANLLNWFYELIVRDSLLQNTTAVIPSTITTSDNENVGVHYTPTSAFWYAFVYCFNWGIYILNTDLSGTYNN